MKISVVTTIYNSGYLVPELIKEITQNILIVTNNYEIILVDDNSKDNSWEKILESAKNNQHIKGIKLSRNYGQQIAMSAGLRYAEGDYIVIMDGDLQNPPSSIPVITEKLNEGYDIVYTVSNIRNNWKDELTSKLFWYLVNKIFKVGIIPNQLMMKGFNKKALEIYNSYDERVRVVAGITHDIGLNYCVINVKNQRRQKGKGNYNFFKRFHLMIELVIALTQKPLEYLINISIAILILSILFGIFNAINFIMYPNIPKGYTSLIILITFFGSLNMLLLGIIGRYLSNIYAEVRKRPLFLISEKINF